MRSRMTSPNRKYYIYQKKLAKGQIKQVRKSSTLLNLLLSGKGNFKQKFETQIKNIKAKVGKVEITTESAIKSRVQDIILSFDKNAKGFKPLDHLLKRIPDIKKSMDVNGSITLQINVSITVSCTDTTTDTLHIHSDKTHTLINNEQEIRKELENHIKDIKDKFENHPFKKSGGTIKSIDKSEL